LAVNQNVVSQEMKTDQSIGRRACRDCGHLLENTARGCPGCAMNLEAERMIERFVWRSLVLAFTIIGVLVGVVVVYLWR